MDTVLIAGQSNALRTFSDPDALFAFENLVGEVEVINAAIGGTPITDVKPAYWTDFSTPTAPYQLMLEEVGEREVDAIIFIGGEGDARLGASAMEVFDAMVDLERHWDRDLGDVPILILPVQADLPYADAVNLGLRWYARYSDDARLVLPDEPIGFEDGLHYDAESRIAVAEVMARVLLDLA